MGPFTVRQFTGWHMLAVMVLFFGTVIGVNLTLAFYANSSWTGLVVKNSYVAGQTYNEELQKAREQAALGYQATLTANDSALEFTFLDKDGSPILADRIEVSLGRPADDVDDHVVVLEYAGAGRYAAPGLKPGRFPSPAGLFMPASRMPACLMTSANPSRYSRSGSERRVSTSARTSFG